MTNLNKSLLTLAIIALLAPMATLAQSGSDARENVVNQRQENQDKRIEQGEKNGSLTKREERRLEREQKHIKKMEENAMKDGKMTKKEFRRVEHAQNQASKDIYRKKHNRRERK